MNTILIEYRSVYGNKLIYPVNDAAKVLAAIAGTKTLREVDIDRAKKLGLTVERVQS